MEQFLFWFGVICAGFISFGFAMYGISCYMSVKHEDHYDGLKNRIADTVTSINEHCGPKDCYTSGDVKVMLIALRRGYWPDVAPTFTCPEDEDLPA